MIFFTPKKTNKSTSAISSSTFRRRRRKLRSFRSVRRICSDDYGDNDDLEVLQQPDHVSEQPEVSITLGDYKC